MTTRTHMIRGKYPGPTAPFVPGGKLKDITKNTTEIAMNTQAITFAIFFTA